MANPGLKPYGYILTSCVWFSAMSLLAHEISREGGHWVVVMVARSGIAALFALAACLALGIRLVVFSPPGLWLRSLSGSISMLATFYALGHMLVSDVLTITNTYPIWVALLAWPLAGEKPTAGVWLAVLCAVAGVAIALQPTRSDFDWTAAACAFVASFFSAVAMLGLNRLKGVAAWAIVFHFSTVSALAGALFLFGYEAGPERFTHLESREVLAMLFGVGVTAAGGQIFLTRAYATGSPTKISVVALSQVLIVMFVEALLGRKEITLQTILGTALVLGPAGWLMARDRRKPPLE